MNRRGAYQKRSQNRENVEARHILLLDGLKVPGHLSTTVIQSLTRQRAFAALNINGKKISPISLNTLKSIADEIFTHHEGPNGPGFAYLNALRLQLKTLVDQQPNARSSASKARRETESISNLQDKLHEVERQNILRSKAYFDLYGRLNVLTNNGSLEDATKLRLRNLLNDHWTLYGALFDPCAAPPMLSKVVQPIISPKKVIDDDPAIQNTRG